MLNIRFLITLVAFGILVNSCSANEPANTVSDFTLTGYEGTSYTLSEIKDAKAIVVMFVATQCPVSNAYNDRMAAIAETYTKRGVVFLAVNSNKQESVDEIAQHAAENEFPFPVLKDNNNVVADKYNAQVTPEIFVVNSKLDLLYHGRIDDSKREKDVSTHDLKNALDEILTGKSVTVKETKSFGCSIKRVG